MSAVGNLDQALAQVVDQTTAALTILTAVQDAWDERGLALASALDGTQTRTRWSCWPDTKRSLTR
ncbi:hypothetical protein GCM10009545_12770 [Saccharopolyspora thermophila]|uniref:Uncharacterized protein n=1 Tax=Saccharopolyspora thermophila TaxID=89367 RepID=A0ABN1C5X0_9PSEU